MKTAFDQKVEQIKLDDETQKMLADIELGVLTNFTLADAIRGGSKFTKQAHGWGDQQNSACALSAAAQYASSLGYV